MKRVTKAGTVYSVGFFPYNEESVNTMRADANVHLAAAVFCMKNQRRDICAIILPL